MVFSWGMPDVLVSQYPQGFPNFEPGLGRFDDRIDVSAFGSNPWSGYGRVVEIDKLLSYGRPSFVWHQAALIEQQRVATRARLTAALPYAAFRILAGDLDTTNPIPATHLADGAGEPDT